MGHYPPVPRAPNDVPALAWSMTVDQPRAAARVLVVEDEFLLACSLEDDLTAFGYAVVGPVSSVAAARERIGRETVDAAVLDVNLSGAMVFPLADELVALRIPIIFLSGYGLAVIPDRFRSLPRLAKPGDPNALDRELRKVLPVDR
jgi:CheY-like chemotaxis protein